MAASLRFIRIYCHSASVHINKASWKNLSEILVTITWGKIIKASQQGRAIQQKNGFTHFIRSPISFIWFSTTEDPLFELYPHLSSHSPTRKNVKELKIGEQRITQTSTSALLFQRTISIAQDQISSRNVGQIYFFNNHFLQFVGLNINVVMHYQKNASHKYVRSVWICIGN